jgi:hypothetical protein
VSFQVRKHAARDTLPPAETAAGRSGPLFDLTRTLADDDRSVSPPAGVGKGILASSTGLLLKSIGLRVTSIKIDPYVSVDAGLMAPAEHGECFVVCIASLGPGPGHDAEGSSLGRNKEDHALTTARLSSPTVPKST